MNLQDLLLGKRAAVADRWLQLTLATYSPDTAAFLSNEKDEFANPVGQRLREGIPVIIAALLEGNSDEAYLAQLGEIIQVQSVQNFPPSRALAFIFLLKEAILQELDKELREARILAEWTRFAGRIDQLALRSMDLYSQFREKVYEIRVNDVKRRVSGLQRRLNWVGDDRELESDCLSDNIQSK